ncbi:MAG: glycosyltransferase family 2 protein [Terrisporobacter othiniensis]|uniref:glycosyltransferase family 2 protein n=1 Tax=Terrisporobacter othiniensis TaxID=1577792 RepID=UPI0029135B7D|nr:glycosyltransferase family 2 protein [Terrisporobacter othiniensis]MDU6983121.1 glycosyltransferase family 2 protein [Terrisporobacter othiniensis]
MEENVMWFKKQPTLTIFTPTYNRAYTLNLCYESMLRQTCKDFEWLIIDDGSYDNTKELVESWIKKDNGFKIRYIYKENGGMHTAHNTAYEHIYTELNMCIDSDDYLTDDAIELILNFWNENKSSKYGGIIALDIFKNGEIIGTELPNKKFTTYHGFYEYGGKGDKKVIYRTDIMKKYPHYPEYKDEKFVGLCYKYLLADQQYPLLILNKPVCVVEYLPDGSTQNIMNQFVKNPKGYAFLRKERMKYCKTFKWRFKSCIHYVFTSIILKNKHFIKESPKKIMTIISIPFGLILYIYINCKIKCDTR